MRDVPMIHFPVSGFVFRAMWPILNEDMTVSQLKAEACSVLDRMAAEQGARIDGEPVWSVRGRTLLCEAPAAELSNVIPMPARRRNEQLPADVVEDIHVLDGRGWTADDIAKHLHISAKSVRRYLKEAA
jgi:hypothetical protein